MAATAIWSTMTAKPGKNAEAERFLVEEALPLIEQEPGTTRFLVLREKPGAYAIFDTFANEAAFQAHLHGPVPKLLAKRAPELFEGEPTILRRTIMSRRGARTRGTGQSVKEEQLGWTNRHSAYLDAKRAQALPTQGFRI